MVDPGLLQRVKRTIVIFEAFDGSYSRANNCSNRGYAGALGSTIDMDSAGTHSAIPQPNLVPVKPSCSRITDSTGVLGSTSSDWVSPLRLKVIIN